LYASFITAGRTVLMDAAANKIKRLTPLFQPFNAQFHFLDAAR